MNACLLLCCATLLADVPAKPVVLTVVGAEGTAEYGRQFREWNDRWKEAAQRGGAKFFTIGIDVTTGTTDRDQLQQTLAELTTSGPSSVWVVLIGHGTFDGKTARFNLSGPDVTAGELAAWVKPLTCPLAVINCSSCSGPFLRELSGPRRVVIVATRSGFEHNYSRFGDALSAAIADPQADLDKDEQTSLLEAFLLASSRVREFYAGEGRLATEHALLDDNGDHLGTPADWFRGTSAIKVAKDGAQTDGPFAKTWHLVRGSREERLPAAVQVRRDEIELELSRLRTRKSKLSQEEYLNLLEPLLVELSALYEAAEAGDDGEKAPRESTDAANQPVVPEPPPDSDRQPSDR